MDDALADGARPVRPGEELELEPLRAHLAAAGFVGEIRVEQFPGGHSNLTYLVHVGDRELVLRRPPRGATIKSAHDMGREFRILSGLHPVYRKVPRPLFACDDSSVLGAPFYVMERVRGLILRGPRPRAGLALAPEAVRRLSASLVEALAELHAVDVEAARLAGEGRPNGYVGRQVRGWMERYRRAQTDAVAEIDEVASWLERRRGPESGATLVHGDFKHDNVVLDPADPTRIIAVLDWEMATVGDPLLDLGTTLGYWLDPDDAPELRDLPFAPTLLPGHLTRAEAVARYTAKSGRPVPNPVFIYVFGLFKVAVIAQQIYRRFKDGASRDARFAAMLDGVRLLARAAARAIDRDRISGLS